MTTQSDPKEHRPSGDDFDPLEWQVCEREDEAVIRDPEVDAEPVIVRVDCGKQAEPVVSLMPERY